ncbi:MAG: bifunctional diaminohydroxyphosphoribosylaminopyrimidine deaminase/5-amino-6-(5-phosphoribosylamino)uracil reductase RibD [Pseudomonadota bacterium]|nr:bifunctional diaminohydroxyphosphoribosylaminopyrimidine deaminase/5-amino-6-(5-phosphoribosylamino)uracil reductase RibD [Pseudomonadota bacterium]MDE3037265.1 bifunctional diaminohydroxyphosphoribosylaminopyrimidine deaminase/5-amino-6-(5-phosphoribosylamino)uracil reductase RibD [Pseudomonadota bacterium]
MPVALSLARRNLGQTWPNPSVGAVVVKNGRIIAEGWTAKGGRPHAETEALAQAGMATRGATLYVTLEPCAHHGKTPPCAEAIINAGIARCVVACRDPNPEATGGIARLQQAGIEVVEGICREEAKEINRGFFSVIEKKRPFIALKIATSLDGKISRAEARLREGGWITGEFARAYGHLLRSRFDAIATGIGTVLADDPLLTCRLPGLEDRSPVRVVFDRQRRLPEDSRLAMTAKDVPLWETALPVEEAVTWLAEKGITRLLVEAGQKLSSAFLHSGLVDRIYWFRSPMVIGEGGLPAFGEGVSLVRRRRREIRSLGEDTLETYERSDPALNAG